MSNCHTTEKSMSKIEAITDIFESQLVNNIAITHLKGQALDIVTNPQDCEEFFTLLKTVNDSPEVLGYVQIHDSEWDSHSAVNELVDLILKDTGHVVGGGRQFGYQHDVIAARFRHSMGRTLLTMIQFSKPAIAGLQGRISGEYLGHTLAYDARIATADTTFSFDSIHTGLPASPGITCLMPRYIGIGRTMSLLQGGSTIDAQEAYSLGLISEIVEDPQELIEHCTKRIQTATANHHHLVKYYRQHILPSAAEVKDAIENYIDAMARSIVQLRKNR
jgi:enoyl-CoA hydratase/carnithine racemase